MFENWVKVQIFLKQFKEKCKKIGLSSRQCPYLVIMQGDHGKVFGPYFSAMERY